MNLLILVLLIIFIITVVILRYIETLLIGNKYLTIIKLFIIALMFNIMILLFLTMSFSKIKLAKGPIGPKGNRGEQGNIGKYDTCGVCGPQPTSVGYVKTEKMKKELIIPEKPIIYQSS